MKSNRLTIPCPECKKVLVRYAIIKGDVSFELKCTHCKELILVNMGQNPFITAKKVALAIVILGVIYSGILLTSMNDKLMTFLTENEFVQE